MVGLESARLEAFEVVLGGSWYLGTNESCTDICT